MDLDLKQQRKQKFREGLIVFGLSMINGLIGIFNWLLLRNTMLHVLLHSSINVSAWKVIDIFTSMLLGMAWLSYVLYTPYFYRKGIGNRRLWQRFRRMTGSQFLFIFICQLIPMLLGDFKFSGINLLLLFIQLIAGAGLICYPFRKPPSTGSTDQKESSF